MKRNFFASKMDRVWVADITYVRTQEGLLYLAFILDVHSRRIVGWAMEGHLRTELVVDALRMAVWRRKPAPGLVHHSEQGVQYTSLSFGERLKAVGITPSVGRTGSALDNALAESFVWTLKAELWSAHRGSLPGGLRRQRSSITWRLSTTPAAYIRLWATRAPRTSRRVNGRS